MIKKSDVTDMYFLSPMQEGMLFHYLMDKTSPAYFEQTSYRIDGQLDYRLFEKAFHRIIDRYDVLRTIFVHEKLQRPLQVVLKKRETSVFYEDVSHLHEDEQEQWVKEFKIKDKTRGFELEKDILIRLAILKLANNRYEIIWSFHHIIMDGWCIAVLVKDMLLAYYSLKQGKTVNLPPAAPYQNYIKWLEKQDKKTGINYWKRYLQHYENQAIIPRHTEEKIKKYEQKKHQFEIKKELLRELIRISNESDVTMNTIIRTLWGILLQKYNNTNDVVFGAIVSGRPANLENVETMVGLFINAVPVRIKAEPGETFPGLIKKVQSQLIQSRSYEFVPLAEIQSQTLLKRELINNLFLFQNYPIDREIKRSTGDHMSLWSVESVEAFEQTTYDLNITVSFMEQMVIEITYNGALYHNHIIKRLEDHLGRIMEQVTAGEIPLEEIEIICQWEKNQILFEFNHNKAPHPRVQAYELFEKQEAAAPGKIAVIYENSLLSYGQLNRNVNRLARLLSHYGIGANHIVGLLLERSPRLFETIMALWKVGAAYIPMETDYPPQRINEILKNSETRFLVTRSEHVHPEIEKSFLGSIIKLDKEKNVIREEAGSNLDIQTDINNLAYILYTSGSTGKPKGVMVEHIGSMNHMRGKILDTQMDAHSIMAQNSPQTFDVSIWQFFAPLTLGSKTVIYTQLLLLEPDRFITRLTRDQVTILQVVPSYLTVLLDSLEKLAPESLPLKYILPTGEELKPLLVKKWFKLFPTIKMINTYGPTEASDDIAHYIMEKTPEMESIPLGKPLQNLNMYIVDNHMKLCPVGIKGEICVSGIGVGRGYIKDEARTKQVFMEDPFLEEKGVRLYKMGDLGCWLPDGSILFFGRKDFQVKIRGHLIECGEIENRLLEIPHVKETVVIDREDTKGNKYLCAYLVSDSKLSVSQVKAQLSAHLPGYMIPAYFIDIDRMPLTPNGKIDRKALPLPQAVISESREYQAPRDEVEKILAGIWEELLAVTSPGINDNFFDSGGHSLSGMTLISSIHKRLNVEIPISELFNRPTIKEISDYIRNSGEDIYSSIITVEKREYYPLSSAQLRLTILDNLEEKSTAYNMPLVMELEGNLDPDRMENALKGLIKRHESLRTAIHVIEGEPLQIIYDQVDFALEYYNKNRIVEKEEKIKSIIHDSFIRPFDLSQAPLIRAGLIKIRQNKYLLMVDIHHIVCDGVAFDIIVGDISKLYTGQGLPALRIQYKDYALWQLAMMKSEKFKNEEKYWLEKLAGEIPVLNLFTDYPRPPVQSFAGSNFTFKIDRELSEKTKTLAGENGTTLYMALLAAYNVLLSRNTGQEDIIVGTPTAGRHHADLHGILGMFVNTLTMRNYPAGEKTFKHFLQEVKKNALNTYQNQDYQFEELVAKLDLNRDLSRNPLFDTLFAVQNMDARGIHLQDFRIKGYDFGDRTAKFDITLYAYETGDEILLQFNYCTKLFKSRTIRRLCRQFVNILEEVVRFPELKLHQIQLLSKEKQERLLYEFNNTDSDYPRDMTIQQWFQRQVQKDPDRIAVIALSTGAIKKLPSHVGDLSGFVAANASPFFLIQITYRELNEKSNRVALWLGQRGVKADTIVGIRLERSIEMIIGIFGIVKAGGAYLPIDPAYPEERIRYMLDDSNAGILLTTPDLSREITYGKEILQLPDAINPLQDHAAVVPTPHLHLHLPPAPVTSLAYVIYTSGSTGKPKGVVTEHHSLVNRLNWMQKTYPLDEGDTILQKTTFTFDVSVWEIFWWALAGAKVCLLVQGVEKEPGIMVHTIQQHHITTLHFVPSMLSAFLEYVRANRAAGKLSSLKQVIASGEELTAAMVESFKEILGNIQVTKLANLYGPTEAAIDVSYYNCFQENNLQKIPIGKPIDNIKLYIIDKHFQLQPVVVAGELCISGVGLARGYLNRPGLTGEKFIELMVYGKVYRTGDLARWLPDGNIEFLGRIDHQVKIRGFRIECGEIESILWEIDGIKEALVTARKNKNGDIYLCAYVVSSREFDSTQLENDLREKLPEYMIPGYFVFLEKFPLTPNGKIDRKQLKEPEIITEGNYMPPRDKTEELLVDIWKRVLGQDNLSVTDNFFRAGGDSIIAIRMISSINSQQGSNLSMIDVYQYQTIEKLAARLRKEETTTSRDKEKEKVLAELEAFHQKLKKSNRIIGSEDVEDIYPMSDIAKGLVFYYSKDIDDGLYHDQGIYQQSVKNFDPDRMKKALALMIKKHPILRTTFLVEEFAHIVYRYKETFADKLVYQDISGIGRKEQEVYISNYAEASRNKPFNIREPLLWRLGVFKTGRTDVVVLWEYHHAIIDGWSNASFLTELNNIYNRLNIEPGFVPQPLKTGYKDFIIDQIIEKTIPDNLKYWKNELSGYNRYEFPQPKGEKAYKLFVIDMGIRLREKMTAAAEQLDTNLNNLCFAAYIYTVYTFTYDNDITTGVTLHNRPELEDADKILGCFLNIVPFRLKIPFNLKWSEYIRLIDKKMLQLKRHGKFSLLEIINVIGEKTEDKNPLFDTGFNFIDFHAFHQIENNEVQIAPGEYLKLDGYERTNFLLGVSINTFAGNFLYRCDYSTGFISEEDARRLCEYFTAILNKISAEPEAVMAKDDIIPPEEKKRLLYLSNNTASKYPDDKVIHKLFEEQVEKFPDRIAVSGDGNRHLTYSQLNSKANALAGLLKAKGISVDSIVGITVKDHIEMIVCILAVLKAGGAYLPLEHDSNNKRFLSILENSNVSVLLTENGMVKNFTRAQNLSSINLAPLPTEPRPFIRDFDSLPIPDRSLVNYEKYNRYIDLTLVKGCLSLQGTRGCPYKCAYCHKIWPKTHVVRSAENIFKEVQLYYNMGVRRFAFIDDIFNLDVKNSSRFFQLIIENGLDVQLFFSGGLRGDILTKEYIDLMVKAGTAYIALALETASPRLQRLIGKNLNIKKFKENTDYICKKYPQVITALFVMLGFPTETEEEALMTLNFIKSTRWIHFPYINVLIIYSNTDMEKLALQNGVPPQAIARSENSAYHELPDTLPFDKSFASWFQTNFLNEYFLSKERLIQVLPHQMKIMTEDEILTKYNTYMPNDSSCFDDLLELFGISKEQLRLKSCSDGSFIKIPHLNKKMKQYFTKKKPEENAFKILLLDLSQSFTWESHSTNDLVDPPLGLMYLQTYLDQQFGPKINGKIAKALIDFDNYRELKKLIEEFEPDLIGIRTLSFHKEFFHRTISVIRQWGINVPIISGGPYATSAYRSILQDRNIDLIVLGEGELTLTELVKCMLENGGKMPDEETLKKIQGIAFIPKEKRANHRFAREIILLDHWTASPSHGSRENWDSINQSTDLAYTLFTSGSTGKPKGVMVEHRSVIRLVKNSNFIACDENTKILKSGAWEFDASTFEIWGALLNGGRLYLCHKNKILSPLELKELIRKNRINTMWLTASLFNYLLQQDINIFAGLKDLLVGGDVLSPVHINRLRLRFPELGVTNGYGPTENTTFSTTFLIEREFHDNIPIGNPINNSTTYIVGKNNQLQPIGAVGELWVGGVGVSRGYLNNPELTVEKFVLAHRSWLIADRVLKEDTTDFPMSYQLSAISYIYKTGDLARWLPGGNIEFIGRLDDQIKIRGFRIEPGEIENRLLKKEGVSEAVVITKEDKSGEKYLCAYIVSKNQWNTEDLRRYLSAYLPDYMIPSFFLHMDRIPLTSNGKVDRESLPIPVITGDLSSYTAPRDEEEMVLAAIWSEVLGIEKNRISIDDDFFGMGGHSLKATILMSTIHAKLHIKVPLAEIFKNSTIRGIADYVKRAVPKTFTAIDAVEKKMYYKISSPQKRLYILHRLDPQSTVYNIPTIWVIEGYLDRERLEETFTKLIRRHESLRTSFQMVDEEPVQRLHDEVDFKVEYSQVKEEKADEAVENFLEPFDLGKAPLFRIRIVSLSETKQLLMVDMHHIITDGFSVSILVEEFAAFYKSEKFPALRIQYKDFSEWQKSQMKKKTLIEQEKYWLEIFAGEIPTLNLPIDYPRPGILSFAGDSIPFTMDAEATGKLNKIANEEDTTMFVILLALYNILLSRISGQEDIIIGTITSGRNHADLKPVMGMFVNTLVLRNRPQSTTTFKEFLQAVKTTTLEAFENQDYQFEDLVERVVSNRDMGHYPLFDAGFSFNILEIPALDIPGLKLKHYPWNNRTAKADIILNAEERGGELFFSFNYCTKLFKKETIERFISYFKKIVPLVVDNIDMELHRIVIPHDLLTAEQNIPDVIFGFNN